MSNINCPKCGTVNNDAAGQFCKHCGASLNLQVNASSSVPYGGYRPNPLNQKKKRNTIIAVVAVVILLVVVIAIAASMSNDSNGGSPFSDTYIEVSKVAPYTSYSSSWQPDEGNRFVVVYCNFTNEHSSEVDLNPFYFSLICSNDMSYTYTWEIDYVMGDVSPASSTTPIVLYFEIPRSVTPSKIKFDGMYSIYDCTADTAAKWTSTPVLGPTSAKLSDVSYSVVTDYNPYFPPEDGNRYIKISVRITNLLATTLDLNPYYFELSTSDGLVHECSVWVDTPAMPDGLQPGGSIVVYIGFEIGLSETPIVLTFDDYSYFTSISF